MTIAIDSPVSRVEPSQKSANSSSFAGLKDRIKSHYDICSSYYLSLWGQHIHHGYWTDETSDLTKEIAQIHLIELLLSRAGYPCDQDTFAQLGLPSSLAPGPSSSKPKLRVLDVGCGVGGTTRYLAEKRGWDVTGVTISSEQIKIAYDLTDKIIKGDAKVVTTATTTDRSGELINLGEGSVKYIQLDAEKMGDYFDPSAYDIVWISEALSHLPDKMLFFNSAARLLKPHGRLVIADWLKAPDLSEEGFEADVKPIEEGMLLPPLDTINGYVAKADGAGMAIRKGGEPMDISHNVKRTWDISLSLIQSPSLWAFAFAQGRDVVAFLRAFQAMRRGFNNGNFRYGVVVFEKKD